MRQLLTPKQYIFTIVFGLLLNIGYAQKTKTTYFVGVWDGNMIQINNPNVVGKNSFCVQKIVINGKKIKTNYKIGGIEINPEEFNFKPEDELLIQIDSKKDCEPTFHSKGFKLQRD
jgi:hypothetical protein